MNYEIILAAIGITQAFISVSLILSAKAGRSQVNVSLAALVVAYGLTFVDSFLMATGLYGFWPPAWVLLIVGYFFIGPTLYLYVDEVARPRGVPLLRRIRWHLWVPGLALLVQVPMLLAPTQIQIDVLYSLADIPLEGGRNIDTVYTDDAHVMGIALGLIVTLLLFFGQSLFYLMLSLRRLRQHLSRARDFFSNIEDVSLNWLRYLVLGMLALWIGSASSDLLLPIFGIDAGIEAVFPFFELAVLYVLLIKGVRQAGVFSPTTQSGQATEDDADMDGDAGPKYAKSALDEERMTRIAAKLERAMSEGRLYEDSALTLADLCKAVGASQNHVSQTLSQKLGSKFFDYVARYRVAAAQDMLRGMGADQTILDVALAVGFNSKSTFNAAFKRLTGETPSEFRDAAREAA